MRLRGHILHSKERRRGNFPKNTILLFLIEREKHGLGTLNTSLISRNTLPDSKKTKQDVFIVTM